MAFGKAFLTKRDAEKYLKVHGKHGDEIRKMSKKIHPRRKKLWHVGSWLDFLNFA